jgi:hypothetical protein
MFLNGFQIKTIHNYLIYIMKIKITLLIFLILNAASSFAQPAIQWQKSIGGTGYENGSDVKATNDGGCIIAGESASFDGDVTGNHGGTDGWVAKLDVNGDIEWERSLGGSSSETFSSVRLTPDGGYIVIGSTSSNDGDVTGFHPPAPFQSGGDIWVVKLDSIGNIEWNNCYGGSNDEAGSSISLTSDGGYILTGGASSTDGDVTGFHPPPNPFDYGMDVWVVKINSTGVLQWQKCLGGSKGENGFGVEQTADNGYIVFGSTQGSYDGDVIGNTLDTTSGSAWIVKLDSAQRIVWQRVYGGTAFDASLGLLPGPGNSYTFGCFTFSYDGDVIGSTSDSIQSIPNYWLVNIDSLGDIQWQKCFGGDTAYMNGGKIAKTAGGYAIGGGIQQYESDFPGYHVDPMNSLSTDYVVIVSDSIGSLRYQHCYGGFSIDQGTGVAEASDKGLFVIGNSTSNDGDVSGHHGQLVTEDIWVIKFAPLNTNVAQLVKPLHAFKVYPNPVTNSANISFFLPVASKVSVNIYDVTGKEIKNLLNENLNSGYQELNWNCTTNDQQDVANGIFIVKITAGGYSSNMKITVVR